jgi:NAD+ synthase (glutamine-hydrolysing)
MGNGIVQCRDTTIASEICEEVWMPRNLHVEYGLDGVEIISNGSGSHHELRKLDTRLDLIKNASARNGGVYMYSNLKGCDGGRLLFDGSSMICMNGKIVTQLPQFSVPEVEVTMAAIELESVRRFRAAMNSRGVQAARQDPLPRVYADIEICKAPVTTFHKAAVRKMKNDIHMIHEPMEEIELAPALWMWDYLRRCGARGFFLPLSGG